MYRLKSVIIYPSTTATVVKFIVRLPDDRNYTFYPSMYLPVSLGSIIKAMCNEFDIKTDDIEIPKHIKARLPIKD